MVIEQLISRLEALAIEAPGSVVMLRRGAEDWFDEIEDVSLCGIRADHQGLNFDPCAGDPINGEVIVIR